MLKKVTTRKVQVFLSLSVLTATAGNLHADQTCDETMSRQGIEALVDIITLQSENSSAKCESIKRAKEKTENLEKRYLKELSDIEFRKEMTSIVGSDTGWKLFGETLMSARTLTLTAKGEVGDQSLSDRFELKTKLVSQSIPSIRT